MLSEWYEPLADEEREALLNKVAGFIERRKLEVPAVLFLESHRPLAYVGSQATLAFSPFLVPFLGLMNVRDFSRFLQEPSNIERLIQRIEESSDRLPSHAVSPDHIRDENI